MSWTRRFADLFIIMTVFWFMPIFQRELEEMS